MITLKTEPPALLLQELQREMGWSEQKAREGFEHAARFVELCALDPSFIGVPSEAVDAVWHRWILHTAHYADYCQKRGGFVHHHPSGAANPVPDSAQRYAETVGRLASHYGVPDARWWAVSADCQRCWASSAA